MGPITGGSLSSEQEGFLGSLRTGGGRVTLGTGQITTTDIAALTKVTRNEYAVVRLTSGERQLVELGSTGGQLPADTERLIIHSHPGSNADAALRSISGDDVNALKQYGQDWSLVVNEEGTVGVFDQNGSVRVVKRYTFGGFHNPS